MNQFLVLLNKYFHCLNVELNLMLYLEAFKKQEKTSLKLASNGNIYANFSCSSSSLIARFKRQKVTAGL